MAAIKRFHLLEPEVADLSAGPECKATTDEGSTVLDKVEIEGVDYLDKLSLEVICHILGYLPLRDVLRLDHLKRKLHEAVSMHLRVSKAIDFTEGQLYAWLTGNLTDVSLSHLLSRCSELRYIYGFHPISISKRRTRGAKQLSIPGVIDALSLITDLRGIEISSIFLLEAILTYLPQVEVLGTFKNRDRSIPIPPMNRIVLPVNPRITSLNLKGVVLPELPRMDFVKHIHLHWVKLNQHPFKDFGAPMLQTFVMANCAGPTNALKYVPLMTGLAAARSLTRLVLIRVPFLGGLIQHLVEDSWRMEGFRGLQAITLGACKHALEVDLGFLAMTCAFRLEELSIQPSLTKDSFFSALNMAESIFPHLDSLVLGFVDSFPESGKWTNEELMLHGLADITENPAMITDIGMKAAGEVFRSVRRLEIYNCPHLHYPATWFTQAPGSWCRLRELTLRRCHAIRLPDFSRFITMLPVLESLHLEAMFSEPPKGCARVGLSAGTGLGVSSALVSNTSNEPGNNDDGIPDDDDDPIPVNNNNDGEPVVRDSQDNSGEVTNGDENDMGARAGPSNESRDDTSLPSSSSQVADERGPMDVKKGQKEIPADGRAGPSDGSDNCSGCSEELPVKHDQGQPLVARQAEKDSSSTTENAEDKSSALGAEETTGKLPGAAGHDQNQSTSGQTDGRESDTLPTASTPSKREGCSTPSGTATDPNCSCVVCKPEGNPVQQLGVYLTKPDGTPLEGQGPPRTTFHGVAAQSRSNNPLCVSLPQPAPNSAGNDTWAYKPSEMWDRNAVITARSEHPIPGNDLTENKIPNQDGMPKSSSFVYSGTAPSATNPRHPDTNSTPLDPYCRPQANSTPSDISSSPLDTNFRPLQPNSMSSDINSTPLDTNFRPLQPNSMPSDINSTPLDTNLRPFQSSSRPSDANSFPLDTNFRSPDSNSRPSVTNLTPSDCDSTQTYPPSQSNSTPSDTKSTLSDICLNGKSNVVSRSVVQEPKDYVVTTDNDTQHACTKTSDSQQSKMPSSQDDQTLVSLKSLNSQKQEWIEEGIGVISEGPSQTEDDVALGVFSHVGDSPEKIVEGVVPQERQNAISGETACKEEVTGRTVEPLVKRMADSALVDSSHEEGRPPKGKRQKVDTERDMICMEVPGDLSTVDTVVDRSRVKSAEDGSLVEASMDGPPCKESAKNGSPVEVTMDGPHVEATMDGSPVQAALDGCPVKSALSGSPVKSSMDGFPVKSEIHGSTVKFAVDGSPVHAVGDGMPVIAETDNSHVESKMERSPVEAAVDVPFLATFSCQGPQNTVNSIEHNPSCSSSTGVGRLQEEYHRPAVKGKSKYKGKGKGKGKRSEDKVLKDLEQCFEISQENDKPASACLKQMSEETFDGAVMEMGFDMDSTSSSWSFTPGLVSPTPETERPYPLSWDEYKGDGLYAFPSVGKNQGQKVETGQGSCVDDPSRSNPTALNNLPSNNEDLEPVKKVTISGDTCSTFVSREPEFEAQTSRSSIKIENGTLLLPKDGSLDCTAQPSGSSQKFKHGQSSQTPCYKLPEQNSSIDAKSPSCSRTSDFSKGGNPWLTSCGSSTGKVNKGKSLKGKKRSVVKHSNGKVSQSCQAVSEEIRETTKKAKENEDMGRSPSTRSGSSIYFGASSSTTDKPSAGKGDEGIDGASPVADLAATNQSGQTIKRPLKRKPNTHDQATSTSDPVIEDDHVQVLTIRSRSLVTLTLHCVGVTDVFLQDCPSLATIQGTSCRVLKKITINRAPKLTRVTFAQCKKLDERHLVAEVCKQPSCESRTIFLRPLKELHMESLERYLFRTVGLHYHMCLVKDNSPTPASTLYNRTRVGDWCDLLHRISYDLTSPPWNFPLAKGKRNRLGNTRYPWGRRIYNMQGRSADDSSWDLMTDIPWLRLLSECPDISSSDVRGSNLSAADHKEGLYCRKAKGHKTVTDALRMINEQVAELLEARVPLYHQSVIVYVNTSDMKGIPAPDMYF